MQITKQMRQKKTRDWSESIALWARMTIEAAERADRLMVEHCSKIREISVDMACKSAVEEALS